jgi:DNA-binding transcriptional MerR regulator
MTLSTSQGQPLRSSQVKKQLETADPGITIEDLSARTGMTVRNIRAHQSRGLLDPPRVVGRTGFYDDEHVGRIALIKELQQEGFNLEAIRRILDAAGGSPGDLVSFTRTAREPYEDEQPEILEAAEIAAPWGDSMLDPDHMERLERLGLMRPLGDGRYEVRSPKMYEAGVSLAELGVSAEDAINALETLRSRSMAVAEVFIDVFLEQVWRPFNDAGRPREDWPRVQVALERMRPMATDAFLASFQFAMEDASERAISEGIRRDLESAPGGD